MDKHPSVYLFVNHATYFPQYPLTAKKLDPKSCHWDSVLSTSALAWLAAMSCTSAQLPCTMFTHCGGLMSRADSAGFGSRNLVSCNKTRLGHCEF